MFFACSGDLIAIYFFILEVSFPVEKTKSETTVKRRKKPTNQQSFRHSLP